MQLMLRTANQLLVGHYGAELAWSLTLQTITIVYEAGGAGRQTLREAAVVYKSEGGDSFTATVTVQKTNGTWQVSESRGKEMSKKLAFQTKVGDEHPVNAQDGQQITATWRDFAAVTTCIRSGMETLSIESQIPEALVALPEATRPHPLAVRGVEAYSDIVLTPYVFRWAIAHPRDIGTDSREQLVDIMQDFLDGKIDMPDEDLLNKAARSYYPAAIEERRLQRERDAEKVSLFPHNWDGYGTCTVLNAGTRREAILTALAVVRSIRLNDNGGKFDCSLLSRQILFDDGNRILFDIQSGFDYYGMRISDAYVYFDPDAGVEYEEYNGDEYEAHTLSITKGELYSTPFR